MLGFGFSAYRFVALEGISRNPHQPIGSFPLGRGGSLRGTTFRRIRWVRFILGIRKCSSDLETLNRKDGQTDIADTKI